MAEVTHMTETRKDIKKRKPKKNRSSKVNKRAKVFPVTKEKVRINDKMRKLFRKRANEYNSDDDESAPDADEENIKPLVYEEDLDGGSSGQDGDGSDADEENGASEDEGNEIQPGITKFMEGCRAFRTAFKKITDKNVVDDSLGPVLSGHKKLVVEKLTEEEAERKAKGEAKKEKHLVGEKGHVKPANFLDSNEKFLIGVATKGVVKLFNAVNKAQNAQKGLNPSRFKDAKALGKRRREAFFSELRKTPSQAENALAKGTNNDEGPAWAPLRDSYMLTSSKLKNWDKMPDTSVGDEMTSMPLDSSSDED